MLTFGKLLLIGGFAGLGYEAILWGWSGNWLPMTVDDVYRSLGVYELLEETKQLRSAASWYLDMPLAALVALYGVGLSLLAGWRRRRGSRAAAVRPSI